VSHRNLEIYLNDHLAGSAAAIGLFDRLRRKIRDPAIVRVLTDLRQAVERDRATLRGLMKRFGIAESRTRKLAALLAQKLANVKLRLSSSRRGDLQLLHALDVLSLGIQGKKALWTALEAASGRGPRPVRYDDCAARADEQLAILRDLRIEVARRALLIGEDEHAAGRDRARRDVPPL